MARARTPGKKCGTKSKLEITPKLLQEVKALVNAGMNNHDIAAYYKISERTWYIYREDNEELDEIIRTGKMRTTAVVASHLIKLCQNDNVPSIIFYLKTQGGWKEAKDEPPISENKPDEKLVITTTDPIEGAKIYQQFMFNT